MKRVEKDTKLNNESLPAGYRVTELGPLPEEWKVVKLGEVATKPQYGFTASAQNKAIGPKMLRITDIQDGNVNWNNVPYCECPKDVIPKYLLQIGDILVARTGSVGKTFLVKSILSEPLIFASYLIRVQVNKKVLDPNFVYLFTQSPAYWSQISSNIHGAVQPNINATQLKSLSIPLPPLEEQKAIAYVLQTVQRVKESTERVIAALKELKKSLMRHLFTYGPVPVDAVDAVELKETELGPIPAHWQVVRLGDVASVSAGNSAPQGNQYFGGSNPFVRVQHIDEDGYYVTRWDLITDEAVNKYHLKLFPKDSIIFPKSGASIRLEKRAILPRACYLVSHLCAVIPDKQVNTDFLFYSLKKKRFSAEKAENYPTLSLQEIKETLISIPPIFEQHEVARILRTVDKRIEAEETYVKALDELFKSLLHNLMTGKIRVKLSSPESESTGPIKRIDNNSY